MVLIALIYSDGSDRSDHSDHSDITEYNERGGAACKHAGGAPSGWFVGHGVPAVSGRCRDGRCGLATVVGASGSRSTAGVLHHACCRVVAIVTLLLILDTADWNL